MKTPTITITRAEYAHLNKAANAAVEHALELVQAARLVDDLKARIAELKAERDAIQADGEELLEENKALTFERADLIREKHAAESRAELAECFLNMTHDAIINALEGAQLGGDYKGNMEALVEVVQHFEL